jgi:hypothetical protein
VEFLRKHDTQGVYALGLKMQAWMFMPQTPEIRNIVRDDARKLLTGLQQQGDARGFYDYSATNPRGRYSHSRSQYGVLGVWAAQQMGLEIPTGYWSMVEQAWIRHQDPSGGWTYERPGTGRNHPLTPSMTAAGVATLFITQDYLHANAGVTPRGNISNPSIDRGLKWIADNFDKVATDRRYPRDFPFFLLYGIERIGVASGYKYIGEHDWYQKGAAWLLRNQKKNGAWGSGGDGNTALFTDMTDTGMAMLFLARGRAPVVMNKLDYSSEGVEAHWNQRPRDVANVTTWIARNLERDLNWQIVTFRADADELLDAPILYIAGSRPLQFNDKQKQTIRDFVLKGGLVLGNADGGNRAFATSFQELFQELFPAYEFRPLPDDHIIFTNQQFPAMNWRRKPQWVAMSNGVRELAVLIPQQDFARAWQLRDTGRNEEVFQATANLFLYAVDKQGLRTKGQTYIVQRDPKQVPTRTIKVGRIKYDGNWDPEPAGWQRLSNIMNRNWRIAVETVPVELGKTSLDDLKVLHLTGTAPAKLDDAAREALRGYVNGGGTLVIDSAGGSPVFNQWIQSELASIFGDRASALETPLKPDDEFIKALKLTPQDIAYRTFTRMSIPASELRDVRLRGMRIGTGTRVGVIYSAEDLSAGLVGQPVDGIIGYQPDSASAIMARLLLHVTGTTPPSTAPAAK